MAKYAKSKKPLVLGLRLSRLSVKKTFFLCFHWTSQTRSRGQDDGSIGYRRTSTSSSSSSNLAGSSPLTPKCVRISMIFAEVPAAMQAGEISSNHASPTPKQAFMTMPHP